MKRLFLICCVITLLLIGCEAKIESVDDINTIGDGESGEHVVFGWVRDDEKGVGMLTYGIEIISGMEGQKARGWGFAVRMTEDEFARFCQVG